MPTTAAGNAVAGLRQGRTQRKHTLASHEVDRAQGCNLGRRRAVEGLGEAKGLRGSAVMGDRHACVAEEELGEAGLPDWLVEECR